MPDWLTNPISGLTPTIPVRDEGQTIEPSASAPIATTAIFAATATAAPELEPQGERFVS